MKIESLPTAPQRVALTPKSIDLLEGRQLYHAAAMDQAEAAGSQAPLKHWVGYALMSERLGDSPATEETWRTLRAHPEYSVSQESAVVRHETTALLAAGETGLASQCLEHCARVFDGDNPAGQAHTLSLHAAIRLAEGDTHGTLYYAHNANKLWDRASEAGIAPNPELRYLNERYARTAQELMVGETVAAAAIAADQEPVLAAA